MPSSARPAERCDILVVGAGIAGASAAAALAADAKVVVIEAESQPGYHTTGRSAAFYAESYGHGHIRPLTSASKSFFSDPPQDFSPRPLVGPRGCLHIFAEDARARAEAEAAKLARHIEGIRLIDADEALARVPVLRREGLGGAIDDPECRDLDVAAIHQGYLAQLKRRGGRLLADAPLQSLQRAGGRWRAETPAAVVEADLVVNAAGAWGDEVARMAGAAPVGLQPMRRTIILFRPRSVEVADDWPLVMDLDEAFYFKPETGRILASPADETPMPPCDVQPDEFDVAVVVDRVQRAAALDVPRIENKWAGLRTFAPDRVPVVGADPQVPGFVWCVGQGGYGIQTAPAIAALTAAVTLGRPIPDGLAAHGVTAEVYSPGRFARASVIS